MSNKMFMRVEDVVEEMGVCLLRRVKKSEN